MYQVLQTSGDTLPVPQLVFTRLGMPDMGEARFRVALYLLAKGQADATETAKALNIRKQEVEQALSYWEGAGLLELSPEAAIEITPPVTAPVRRRMNSREVAIAAETDATLGDMIREIQRIFGGVVGEGDTSIFITLYHQDGFPADLILMAAYQSAAEQKISARYIEKKLFGWRKEGIMDCATADIYLRKLAERGQWEDEVSALFGQVKGMFTLAEKRRIAQWTEDFGFDIDMVKAARLEAGDKENEIKYLHAILKRWHGKGYKTSREVALAEEGRNLRVQSPNATIAPEDDMLMQAGYVPMKRRRERE